MQLFYPSTASNFSQNPIQAFTLELHKLTSTQTFTASTLQTRLQTSITPHQTPQTITHPFHINSFNMPVNWKDPEAFTRLLAAMVAAQDMKVYRQLYLMSCRTKPLLSATFITPVCGYRVFVSSIAVSFFLHVLIHLNVNVYVLLNFALMCEL